MGHSTTTTQPAVAVIDISDLTASQRGHGRDRAGWDAAAFHAPARTSRDRATQVGHRRLSLDEPARADTNASARRSARLRHLSRAAGTVEGIRVRPGMLVVAEPETEPGLVVDPGYGGGRSTWCRRMTSGNTCRPASAPKANFAGRAALKSWAPIRSVPRNSFVGQETDSLRVRRKPAKFDDGRSERHSTPRWSCWKHFSPRYARPTLCSQSARRWQGGRPNLVVKMAEEHVLSRAGEAVHVSDLCLAGSLQERTLELAFKEVMGLSPVTYLTRLRLCPRTRRPASCRACASTLWCATQALKWGFWHFGEFLAELQAVLWRIAVGDTAPKTRHARTK